MEINAFVPNELKKIEVDVEKKIFNVNGVPFGDRCTGFSISCDASDGFVIRMEIDTMVILSDYDLTGSKKTDHAHGKRSQ